MGRRARALVDIHNLKLVGEAQQEVLFRDWRALSQ